MNNLRWRLNKLIKIHKFYKKNIIENNNFRIIDFDLKNGELPLWTDVWCNNRNKLYKYLEANDIICRYYWKPLNTNKPFISSFKNLPNSKSLQNKLMWLPSSLTMNTKQQKKICSLINLFYSK